MKLAIDTSVIIAALDGGDPDNSSSRKLLLSGKFFVHAHALAEAFSTLTGGRLAVRLSATDAASILRQHVAPRLVVIALDASDLLTAFDESTQRGIRGGAIYDFLHLAAARKAGAAAIYTLDTDDFLGFRLLGDPEVRHP